MKEIIILNAGSRTRTAFVQGVNSTPLRFMRSKEMLLHISESGAVSFVYKSAIVDFTDTYVFTRLRASDSHFCGILYEHLDSLGVTASDSINNSFRMSEEKISQMARLARAAIPVPATIIAREESYAANRDYILSNISFPLVYKTDGSQGKNVHRVETLAELESHIASKKPSELFILQTLIPNTFDTRTLVAYGKVLGTIKRTAATGTFHNNVSQGATVDAYELTTLETSFAVKAASVNRLDFGGVDMIHTAHGPVILEVNKSPQIRGFERVYGKDEVFSKIGSMIENGEF